MHFVFARLQDFADLPVICPKGIFCFPERLSVQCHLSKCVQSIKTKPDFFLSKQALRNIDQPSVFPIRFCNPLNGQLIVHNKGIRYPPGLKQGDMHFTGDICLNPHLFTDRTHVPVAAIQPKDFHVIVSFRSSTPVSGSSSILAKIR